MVADIYTKAFSDSRKWKHACMQIGLLEPEMLTDPETLKMVTSSFDPKKGTMRSHSAMFHWHTVVAFHLVFVRRFMGES